MKELLHTDLKTGLTTGSYSAAAAKAATHMLLTGETVCCTEIKLPSGEKKLIEIAETSLHADTAQCMAIKDAGDDPDITNGIKIYAKAKLLDHPEIIITAGIGIGTVTRPGLAVEPGKPAINPVPLKMIRQSIAEILPPGKGAEVEISIPEGVEIAKKTFNPKLGIVGGISVLGTTGIVKPMSEEALKASLELHLKQLAEEGCRKAIFVPGNYAANFLTKQYKATSSPIVQMSNYAGFMLEKAVKYKFTDILIVGHIGKLIKLAGGIFCTHSKIADARNEILCSHYLCYSKDPTTALQLMSSNTAEEASELVSDKGFWDYLAVKIKERASDHIYQELKIETVLFSQSKGPLGKSTNSPQLESCFGLQKEPKPTSRIKQTKQTEIIICGAGPGNPNLIIPEIFKELQKAEVIVGSERHLELVENHKAYRIVFTGKLKEIDEAVSKHEGKRVVVLVSGDTGFYSLRKYISNTCKKARISCHPGISSFQYLYAKLNKSYEKAYLASLHGKDSEYTEQLKQFDSVFLLTDKKNTYAKIAQTLTERGLGDTIMHVGNRLSYHDEQIITGTANELAKTEYSFGLCCLVLERRTLATLT